MIAEFSTLKSSHRTDKLRAAVCVSSAPGKSCRSFAIRRFCSKSLFAAFLQGVVATVICASPVYGQFHPDHRALQAEAQREHLELTRNALREQSRVSQAQRSALAHARMPEDGTLSTSGSPVGWESAHPGVFRASGRAPSELQLHGGAAAVRDSRLSVRSAHLAGCGPRR